MKRLLIGFAAAMCLTASVFASDVMTGGWEATAETAITNEVQEVFDKALKDSNDEDYEPIALLSTQVAATSSILEMQLSPFLSATFGIFILQ